MYTQGRVFFYTHGKWDSAEVKEKEKQKRRGKEVHCKNL